MSQSELHPRMAHILNRIARAQSVPMHERSVAAARLHYEAVAEVLDLPRAPLKRVEDLTIQGCGGRLYADSYDEKPVLLYLHGGGFTVGSVDTHDSLCRQLALGSGIAVLSLNYRLAPEHRFPAAVDDTWAALQWLGQGGAARLGLDGRRLLVGGDSAGGTLAAVASILARDVQLALKGQLLITPGTDALPDRASHQKYGQGFLLDLEAIQWFFGHYIDPDHRQDWRFAPLQAMEHEGLAPCALVLAGCDPLLDEGLAYGDALRAARVPVELILYPGVTHDFIKMGRSLPQALEAHKAINTWLRQAAQA